MSVELSLQEMMLGYLQQMGALVEPPAYGIYDVLLPDDVAERWGVDAIQRFSFTAGEEEISGVTRLYYGHPLVDRTVEEIRELSANAVFSIQNVRLEKPGLFDVIKKTLALPNARLFPVHGVMERKRMYHYLRFNFKASLIADEKREMLLPIWMHLQGGYWVKAEEIERLAAMESHTPFGSLPLAEPFFHSQPNPLSPEVLRDVLERARRSAALALGDTLTTLQKGLSRYLELDQARLSQYYEDLKKDALHRLQKADPERREVLELKITAIDDERVRKLADVQEKYHLRVELDLVNLALIQQPKLDLTVEIKKRTAATQRTVVWDPLRHMLEPLVCDVCGQPGSEMYLCENGHLSHANCQAPQCVECKRSYCLLCDDQVQGCVVCNRPVCAHSLVHCPQCQRVTCHEHANLCHADQGQPLRITAPAATSPVLEAAPEGEKAPPPGKERKGKTTRAKAAGKTAVKKDRKSASSPDEPRADRIDIYFGSTVPVVDAQVMARKKQIAVRSWELTPEGIAVHCECGNWFCQEDRLIYRPFPDEEIENQLMREIRKLMQAYHLEEQKLHFYRMRAGEWLPFRRLALSGKWKDPAALQAARNGFDLAEDA